MEKLRVALLQNDIIWENVDANLAYCEKALQALDADVDVAVLPEMFTTGFSMSATQYAEEGEGKTLTALKEWAARYDMALAGSYIAREDGKCYNRGFFVKPCGEVTFYDKRHLFRMGDEGKVFTAGDRRVIVEYREWRIALFICYDLRFPVWSRNVENEYDVALYMASWPQVRSHVWRSLLVARAIENQCYVAGVNRVGSDPSNEYSGGSMIIDPYGRIVTSCEDGTEMAASAEIDMDMLEAFRKKFPVLNDSDVL